MPSERQEASSAAQGHYATIVADPPWDVKAGPRSLHDPGERSRLEQHGYVWFAGDLALAASIARHLGIDLEIDGVAAADEVPGVTQG